MVERFDISEIDQYVIDYVRKLRKKHKQKQADIAVIIQTGRTFVTNVESSKNKAKYNLTHIDLLADHYGKSPRDFLPEKSLSSVTDDTNNNKDKKSS